MQQEKQRPQLKDGGAYKDGQGTIVRVEMKYPGTAYPFERVNGNNPMRYTPEGCYSDDPSSPVSVFDLIEEVADDDNTEENPNERIIKVLRSYGLGISSTFRQCVITILKAHGLWDNEAEEVFFKAEEEMHNMDGRWDDDVGGYPAVMFNIVWNTAKDIAIRHLEATKPQHFALSILKKA
jgi:hypothetical protein